METFDVAVIGAGVGGLATAYRLDSERTTVVLEAEPDVGGRTKMAEVGGELAPTAAAFVYLGTPTERMSSELGIEVTPVVPSTYSCFYRDCTVVGHTDGEFVAGMPLSPADKVELAKIIAKIRSEYETYSGDHGLAGASGDLNMISFAEYIGDLSLDLRKLLEQMTFAHNLLWPDELSAQYALRYLSSYIVRDPDHRSYVVPTGLKEIADRLAEKLGDIVRTEHSVNSVERTDDGFVLSVTTPDGDKQIGAGEVVMAVPGERVGALAPWLPDWKLTAISEIPTAAAVTLAVAVKRVTEGSWIDICFMPTFDLPFCYLINPRVGDAFDDDETLVFQLGQWREFAEEIIDRPDEEIVSEWLDGLKRIFPGIDEHIVGAELTKWHQCFAGLRPNRAEVLPRVEEAVAGVHFVGDYASATAGTHGAIGAGERAAAEILASPASG